MALIRVSLTFRNQIYVVKFDERKQKSKYVWTLSSHQSAANDRPRESGCWSIDCGSYFNIWVNRADGSSTSWLSIMSINFIMKSQPPYIILRLIDRSVECDPSRDVIILTSGILNYWLHPTQSYLVFTAMWGGTQTLGMIGFILPNDWLNIEPSTKCLRCLREWKESSSTSSSFHRLALNTAVHEMSLDEVS